MNKREEEKLRRQEEKLEKEKARIKAMSVYEEEYGNPCSHTYAGSMKLAGGRLQDQWSRER